MCRCIPYIMILWFIKINTVIINEIFLLRIIMFNTLTLNKTISKFQKQFLILIIIVFSFYGCTPQPRYSSYSSQRSVNNYMEKTYRKMGASELAIAIKTGNYSKAKGLVDSGADIFRVKQMDHENENVKYAEGLQLAIKAMIKPNDDNKKIVKLLLEKGAYKNSKSRASYSNSTLNIWDKSGYLTSLFEPYKKEASLAKTKEQQSNSVQFLQCIDKHLNKVFVNQEASNSQIPKIFPQQGVSNAQFIKFAGGGQLMMTSQPYGGDPLKLFDYSTGREIQSFSDKEFLYDYASPNLIMTSRDKKNIALSSVIRDPKNPESSEYKYTIYHIASKKILGTCTGTAQGIYSSNPIGVALSPNNDWIVQMPVDVDGAKYTTKLSLVNRKNSAQTFLLKTFNEHIISPKIIFSPDSKKLAFILDAKAKFENGKMVYQNESKVFIWDVISKQLLENYTVKSGTKEDSSNMAISSYALDNESNLYQSTLNSDNKLKLWSNGNEQTLDNIGKVDNSLSIALSPDNSSLLVFKDGTLHEINKDSGKPSRVFINANPLGVTISNNTLQLKSKKSIFNIDKKQLTIKSINTRLSVIPKGYHLWLTNEKYTIYRKQGKSISPGRYIWNVKLYDTDTNKLLNSSETTDLSAVFSPDGSKMLFSGLQVEGTKISTTYTMKSLPQFKTLWSDEVDGMSIGNESTVFFPDGKRYVTGGKGDFFIKNSKNGNVLQKITNGETNRNQAFAISDNGKYCALWGTDSSQDQKLLIYTVNRGKINVSPLHVISFKNNTGSMFNFSAMTTRLKFDPDNNYLYAYGSKISSININSAKVRDFSEHNSMMTQLVVLDNQRLLSATSDGSVKVWNKNSGQQLGSFSSFGDKEWVWITPNGYFDSSKNGAKYLNVNIADKTLSIDQFYEQLYRPDLLYTALSSTSKLPLQEKALSVMLATATNQGMPPMLSANTKLQSKTTQREQDLEIKLMDQGGGIGKVEWRINGMLIGLDGEERGLQKKSSIPAKQSIDLKRTLTLSPGENTIEVIAYNDSNEIASDPLTLHLSLDDAISQKPALYVLAIGVNKYRDKSLRLNYAVPDSQSLTKAFGKVGKKVFTKVNIIQLLDADVTKDKINNTFKKLSRKTNSNDVFIMYLAGHGVTLDAKYYFLPVDFRYRNEDSIKQTAIQQNDLQKWLSQIAAQKSLVLLDTCNSGGYVQAQAVTRGLTEKTAIDKLTRATGRATIAASSDTQVAYEGYKGHGVFTWAIINALQKADKSHGNKDGVTTTNELSSYIDEIVPDITYKKWGYEQVPQANLHGRPFPIGITQK